MGETKFAQKPVELQFDAVSLKWLQNNGFGPNL